MEKKNATAKGKKAASPAKKTAPAPKAEAGEKKAAAPAKPETPAKTVEAAAPAAKTDVALKTAEPVSNENVAPANAAPEAAATEKAPLKSTTSSDETEVEISWKADYAVKETIEVTGSFTQWEAPVKMTEKDGSWAATVSLPKGKHLFKFLVDGEWMYDLSQPHEADEAGIYNNVIEV